MTRFEAPRGFHLAACLLCSASYLLTQEAFLAHLRCVHAALVPDGMYVLELTHPSELTWQPRSNRAWKVRDGGGELEILCGDPARAVNGVWHADVRLCYRPSDGSAAVSIRDEADQRGYTFNELARLAEQTGFAIEVALGAFDEEIALNDAKAHRMLLALRRVPTDGGSMRQNPVG